MPPIQPPALETERLLLRPFSLDDAVDLFALYRDPATMRFMPTPPHGDVDQARGHLAVDMGRDRACGWSITLRGDPTAVGVVNFLGETALPGMGYILRRDLWGQGIVPEACAAALTYGFESLGYDRVELWIEQENRASQRVAGKLGFRLRGQIPLRYKHRDREHMMLVYGCWAHEWLGRAEPETPVRFFSHETVLMVHDVAATAAYYRDKLGFRVDFLFGEPPNHAGISRGDWTGATVTLQLTAVPLERPIVPAGYLYIFVDARIDRLHAEYRANGVEILAPPETKPWGLREFSVRDPNGHILRFGARV